MLFAHKKVNWFFGLVVAVVVAFFLSLVSIVVMEPSVSMSKGLWRSTHQGPDISVETRRYVGFDFYPGEGSPSPLDCSVSIWLSSQKHRDYYVKIRLKRSFNRATPDAQPITKNESYFLCKVIETPPRACILFFVFKLRTPTSPFIASPYPKEPVSHFNHALGTEKEKIKGWWGPTRLIAHPYLLFQFFFFQMYSILI